MAAGVYVAWCKHQGEFESLCEYIGSTPTFLYFDLYFNTV